MPSLKETLSVQVPISASEWAREMEEALDKPITKEVRLQDITGVRTMSDFRSPAARWVPYVLLAALALGLGALFAPHLFSEEPARPPRSSAPAPEVVATLSSTQASARVAPRPTDRVAPAAPEPAAPERPAPERPAPQRPAPERASPKPAASERAVARPARPARAPGLPQSSIQQIVQQNAGSLTYCYQKAQKREADASAIQTTLTFKVLPNGSTDAASTRLSGQHKGGKLEACVRMAVQRWRFPSAEGPSEVRYPLNFTPGF